MYFFLYVFARPARHFVVAASGNLHIANVTQADRGVYQCLAYNSVSGMRLASPLSYRLIVSGKCRNSPYCQLNRHF